MNRRVKAAILKTGGTAYTPEGGGSFAVSIQPQRSRGDGHTELGPGFLRRFTIYASCEGAAAGLREGSLIVYGGNTYSVLEIETHYFRGKAAVRRGTIILEREGADGQSQGA